MATGHQVLRLPQVIARTGLARSTLYLRVEEGRFPTPISLGRRSIGWIEAEIDEWLNQRIDDRRKTTTTEEK